MIVTPRAARVLTHGVYPHGACGVNAVPTIAGEDTAGHHPPKVEQWVLKAMEAVEVGCHQHLIVEPIHGAVEWQRMTADLHVGAVAELTQMTDGRANAPRECTTETLVGITLHHLLAIRVGEGDPDAA